MTDKATQIITNAMRSTGCYEHVNIEDHAQIIRAALKAARIELIELPEPDGTDTWGIPACGEYNGWTSTGDSVNSVEITDDGIEVDTFGELTPDEARALAAALLAAAHTAETQP